MTSMEAAGADRRGRPMTALRALWSARTWRATLHALVGLPVGVLAFLVTFCLPFGIWYGAFYSLLYAPPTLGNRAFAVTFVVLAIISPVPVLWSVHAFSALQRGRFRTVLGVEIPAPSRAGRGWALWAEGRWLKWLATEWRSLSTWRQLGYHALALVIGVAGAALVALFWSAGILAVAYAGEGFGAARLTLVALVALALAMLAAAPWVARGVARADELAARALLGPGRTEELAQRVESLARSRAEILEATDAERRRIERDLHDGAQQRLVSLAMHLGMARANLVDLPEPARQAIEQAHDEAVQALAELREFVRGLHPAVLNDRGLDAALSGIVARAPLPVRLRVDMTRRCAPSIEAVAYFVVSEALTNVAKHAEAGHAEVSVERTGDRLRVAVSDDGRGGAALDGGGGSGLRGLAQRAGAVDGTLTIHSPSGGPTTITVELPCGS